MRGRRTYYTGITLGGIGIILLLILIATGVAYPNTLFKILAPMGLLFVFLGVLICFIGWILMVKDAAVKKSYSDFRFLLFIGILIFLIPIFKMLFFK